MKQKLAETDRNPKNGLKPKKLTETETNKQKQTESDRNKEKENN